MVVMLNMCCNRCDLRKGCTIIGALWLVFSVLVIVGAPLAMRQLEKIEHDEAEDLHGPITLDMQHILNIEMTTFRAIFYGVTAISVVDAVFSIMLILGACWDKYGLVFPWVVQQLVLQPVWDLLVLAWAVYCYMGNHLFIGTIAVFLMVVRTGAALYSILVVYGLYKYLTRKHAANNPSRTV